MNPQENQNKSSVSDDDFVDEVRKCPYCGITIETRPYWGHIANAHPNEYENSRATWYPLFKDYTSAGMDAATVLMVMPELFNTPAEEIESFLIDQEFKDKTGQGMAESDVLSELATFFNKDVVGIKKILGI
nr:hypothetical protein [Candidatus Sigynarchaeota archaeon]